MDTVDLIQGMQFNELCLIICRHNLFFNKNGDVVFHSAATGVVYNQNLHTQQFFINEHTDDIISMALHPSGDIVATGQVGKDPQIIIWNTSTLSKLSTLTGAHERGVCALAFSPDGNTLLSVGLDDKHTIVQWRWRTGIKLASGYSMN